MTFQHILVPTDGSEFCDKAIRLAASLARDISARVTAVHAIAVEWRSDMSFIDEADLRKEASHPAEARAQKVREHVESLARELNVEIAWALERGRPWESIVRAAEERRCDLIVMATHGRSGATAMLLGSETQKVLAHAKVPVLATR